MGDIGEKKRHIEEMEPVKEEPHVAPASPSTVPAEEPVPA